MPFEYLAGAIFTTQEVVLFCAVAFLALGTFIGLLIFIGRKLMKRLQKKEQKRKPSLAQSILIGFVVITAIILIFFVIPTKVKDARWEKAQSECAKTVGYVSPAEDNSDIATAESQAAYRQCLNL